MHRSADQHPAATDCRNRFEYARRCGITCPKEARALAMAKCSRMRHRWWPTFSRKSAQSGRSAGFAHRNGSGCLQAQRRPAQPGCSPWAKRNSSSSIFRADFPGIPFGILQCWCGFGVQPWWFLTVGGAAGGRFHQLAGNRDDFQPGSSRAFGPFMLHGLFMRRQRKSPPPTARWWPRNC